MSKEEHLANVSTKQNRIAEIARKYPAQAILSLAHNIDLEWLYVAYLKTRKDGAVGIDQQTAEEYSQNLRGNLESLLNRFKSGRYRAPAVRRVYIPKGIGDETRPLGIPTFEDKVLQQAVKMVLEPVWEQEFYDCSYGFRPGKGAHQALKDLRTQCMNMKGGWVIDLDISKYFDTIDHGLLRDMIKQRVCDGVIIRIIGKWLKAGIIENNRLSYTKTGTPQGGVISPLLSNVYLHYVLDDWYAKEVKPRMLGLSLLIRYADDATLCFQNKEDTIKVFKVLSKRFSKFSLTLHPKKTKLLNFKKPRSYYKDSGPGTFTFLGFTMYWGKTQRNDYVVKCKTDKGRLARSINILTLWLKRNRHVLLVDQWRKLCRSITGHYAYYGTSFNHRSLNQFVDQIRKSWYKWLSRRSQKNNFTWEKFNRILNRYPLPIPKVYHPLWSKT